MRFSIAAIPVLLLVFLQEAAGQASWMVTLSGEELARCTRDRYVEFNPSSQSIQLAQTYLISDSPMRSSLIREDLDGCEQVRKTFELDSPAREVEVLFYAGWVEYDERPDHRGYPSPSDFNINGHSLRHVRDRDKMLTGGWDRFTIPGQYLKQGKNELIVSGTGSLWVDADATGEIFKRRRTEVAGRSGPEDNLSGSTFVCRAPAQER
jgi:hypothetical protein